MPQSKFGGVPVQESKFGGVPVDDIQPTVPGTEKLGGAPPAIAKPPQPAGLNQEPDNFITSPNGLIRTGLSQAAGGVEHMAQLGKQAKYEGASDVIRGIGRAALPAAIPAAVAAPVAALGAAAGGYAGEKLGRAGARLINATPEGEQLAGDVAALPAGIIGSRMAGATSAMARPIMRSAMRLPSNESAEAVLNETGGVRPGAIAESAGQRIKSATQDRDALISKATEKPSLAPARGALQSSAQGMISGNKVPLELRPMIDRLHTPAEDPVTGLSFQGATEYPPGAHTPVNISPTVSPITGPSDQPVAGTPKITYGTQPEPVIAERQNPDDFLGIRGNFGRDFTKFDSARPLTKPALKAGNSAYMQMTHELHRVAPGSEAQDELIHNLIPAQQQGQLLAKQPGPIDRGINRLTRQTGAMAVPAIGFATGGAPGAAAAMTAQEMLADPTARAAMARGIRGISSPIRSRAAAVIGSNAGN